MMKKRFVQYLILAAVLFGLPLVCIHIGNRQELLEGLMAFPPRTEDWGADASKLWNMRKPFSWSSFIVMTTGVLAVVLPFVWRLISGRDENFKTPERAKYRFPLFGWGGIILGIATWITAWNRFEWFTLFQKHTFLPFWIAYILIVNALNVKRTGRCLMTSYPAPYALLFPVSAAFWWFFEYLNRYVWNWYYAGIEDMSSLEYLFFATCSFSTVLPAVTATAELLSSFSPYADRRLCGFKEFDIHNPLSIIGMTAIAITGLTGIVFFPHLTFPLLWISPLATFLAVEVIMGEKTVLDGLRHGDWRLVVRFATAALICGWFWEMWNWHSAAKWIYAVPYVHRFQIFEMPVIGFTGYLPFGLECAAVAAWIMPALAGIRDRS